MKFYPSLLILAAGFLITGVAFAGGKKLNLTDSQTEALRREMVDMDLQFRTLASNIALGYSISAAKPAYYLSKWQTSEHPRLAGPLKEVIAKFKSDGTLKYAAGVQKRAATIKGLLQKSRNPSWSRVQKELNGLMASCRGCHNFYDVD